MRYPKIGSTLLLIHVFAQLAWWDLHFKARIAIHYPSAHAHVDRKASWCARRLFALARFFRSLRLLSEVAEQELPPQMLILANHQSVLDIIAIMAAFRNHSVRFVAKAELAYGFPTVSQVLRIQRHALIYRDGQFNVTMRRIDRLARTAVGTVCPVVFPEGTRSRDGRLKQFHNGAVRRMLEVRPLPVVALAIDGGHHMATMSGILKLPHRTAYRLRVVQVFPAPKGKREILATIDQAHSAVGQQLQRWRHAAQAIAS